MVKDFFYKTTVFLTFYSKSTSTLVLVSGSNWAKTLDPDPNSKYLNPQHCLKAIIFPRLVSLVPVCCRRGRDRQPGGDLRL